MRTLCSKLITGLTILSLSVFMIPGFALAAAPTVVLNSPANGSSDSDTTPTLNFTGTDAESDTIEYIVQISSDPFTQPLDLGVHTSKGASASDSTATDAAITTTDGSIIIIGLVYGSSSAPPTMADSKSNTWTKVGTEFQSHSYPGYQVFYKNEGGTRGASHTFTATKASGYTSVFVQEILGTSPVVDTVNTGNRDTTSTYNSNSYTNGSADEYLLALSVSDTNADPLTYTWGDSFTSTGDDINSQSFWQGTLAYRLVSSVASYAASGSSDGTITGISFQILGVKDSSATPLLQKFSTSDSGFTAGNPFASGAAVDFTVQAGDALTPGTYYWRVRGIDPLGGNTYGAWSSTRNFTVTSGGGATPSRTLRLFEGFRIHVVGTQLIIRQQ